MKSSSHKNIGKNILSLGLIKGITAFFPLVVIPYLLATIGIEHYGMIIFALAFVSYFYMIIDYSFKITAVREISKMRTNKDEMSNIVSNVLSTKLLIMASALITGVIIILATPTFFENATIFLILLASIIGYALKPHWFFAGIEKMEYIAIFTLIFKCMHVLAIFIFVHQHTDLWIYAAIISSEHLLIAITGLLILKFKFAVQFHLSSFTAIRQQLNNNKKLFINQLLPNLYNNTTTVLLGFFGGSSITGIYGILRKIINIAEHVLNIISTAFFPAINRNQENTKIFRITQWATALSLCGILVIASPFLLKLLDIYSTTNLWSFIIFACGLLGLTLYNIYGINYFIVKKKDQLVFMNTLILSIIGFLCAFPAIYWGGIIGAATIVTGTRFAIGSRLFFKSRNSQFA